MAASRTKDITYLGARYQRLVPRLGKKKTIVAVEHSILSAQTESKPDEHVLHRRGVLERDVGIRLIGAAAVTFARAANSSLGGKRGSR